MKSLMRWLLTVLLFTALGAAGGRAFGEIVRQVNQDMVVSAGHYAELGWRACLLLGTLYAAAGLAGCRRPARFGEVLLAVLFALFTVAFLSVIGAGGAYALARIGVLELSKAVGRQVGHPYRVFFCRGLELGAVAGLVLAGAWGVASLWRKRRGRPPIEVDADGRPKCLTVCILDTSTPGSHGSMARYAENVERMLAGSVDGIEMRTVRRCLAPSPRLLALLPGLLRNAAHHALVWWRAGRVRPWEADVFHVADGSHAYIVPRLRNVPVVVTAHDVIPLLQSDGRFDVPSPGARAVRLIRRSVTGLHLADAVACDSECTLNDLVDVADVPSEKLHVVPLSAPAPLRSQSRPWPERRDGGKPLVLHVGNDAFYKNRPAVVRAFAGVRKECEARLVLVGPLPSAELSALIGELGIGADVEFRQGLTQEELVSLYNDACLLLFPSLYEGFGWPPVEAMAHGCPVVCSNAASLPEVVGDAALTADPNDHAKLAEHVLSVLGDEALAEDLVMRGFDRVERFSKDRVAPKLVAVCCAALERRKDA